MALVKNLALIKYIFKVEFAPYVHPKIWQKVFDKNGAAKKTWMATITNTA